MKIAIVGVGGVGGYIGAKLIKSSLVEVKLFCKDKELEIMKKEGLKVIDLDQEFWIKPDFTPVKEGDIFDVVFITVKSYSFKSACERIKKYIDKRSLIIVLSNGVGHNELIKSYLKNGIVCYGCVYIVSQKKRAGVIVKKSPLFYLVFGNSEITESMKDLQEVMSKSSLKCKLTDNAEYECWKKYLFIASFATLTSYYKEPMNVIFEKYYDILIKVLHEVKCVANVLNIPLNDDDIKKVIRQGKSLPPNAKTSMQLDFEKKRETELESLCGYIIKKAKEYNIEVNEMQKMYDALKKR